MRSFRFAVAPLVSHFSSPLPGNIFADTAFHPVLSSLLHPSRFAFKRLAWCSRALGLCLYLLLAASQPAFCQGDSTIEDGVVPYRSYQAGDFDIVNTVNGNVMLHIPLVSFPQKGRVKLSFSLNYSNLGWHQSETCSPKTGCKENFGRAGSGPHLVEDSYITPLLYNLRWSVGGTYKTYYAENYVSMNDSMGASHSFGYNSANLAQLRTTDGSGYLFLPTDPNLYLDAGSPIGTFYGPDGIARIWGSGGLESISDRDGNTIQYSNTANPTYTDTLGRIISAFPTALSTSTTGCPAVTANYQPLVGSSTWTVPGPNGQNVTYLFCYATVNVSSENDGNPFIAPRSLLQSLVLPDKTFWQFVYDSANPSGSTMGYGDLIQVITPAGGSISYTYGHGILCFIPSSTFSYASIVSTRTVSPAPGKTFVWNYSLGTATNGYTRTITDPNQEDTVYSFSYLTSCESWETNHKIYAGKSGSSTLLKTVTVTGYNFAISPQGFNGGLPAEHQAAIGVSPQGYTTTLDNGMSTTTLISYDSGFVDEQPVCSSTNGCQNNYEGYLGPVTVSFGRQTDEKTTDYGGAILRDTKTEYQWQANSNYLTANLLDLPYSVTVFNGSGQQSAMTTYGYDENNGSPQGVFGNQTSVTRWLSGGTSPKSQTVYNSAGMTAKLIDPLLNVTTYTYDSTGAFPQQIQYPTTANAAHIEKFVYDSNSGRTTSHTDQNNNVTTFSYDSMARTLSMGYPDTGRTTYCYTDTGTETGGGTCSVLGPPYQVIVSEKISGSASRVSTLQIDGFGRQTRRAVTNGESFPYDEMDTCYDGLGRVTFKSYPFQDSGPFATPLSCGSPENGDSFAYDSLNRTTSVTHPDGTSIITSYTGRATSVQDEGNGTQRVQRISQVDGLGRLTSVCEVSSTTLAVGISGSTAPASCGQDIAATGFLTTYAYDALNNLTSVAQGPLNPRIFVYDSLSRMTSSTNPESNANGTATIYTYDANGNTITKVDARGITICYGTWNGSTCNGSTGYDALNRLLLKTYSDGTLQANFQYDAASNWGQPLSNPIGRLTEEWTGTTSNPTATIFSYDAVGRTAFEILCTPLNCPSNTASRYSLTYSYDLLGDVTAATNGLGVTFSYGHNAGARLTSVTSSLSNSNHPGTLFSAAHYNAAGSLVSATLGNGVNETRTYDARLRLTAVTDGSLYKLTIPTSGGYAADSNILAANDSVNGNWTYTYGALDRLTASSQNSGTNAYSYAYDRFGNRWQQNVTHGTGSPSSLAFDANNRITASGVAYDAAGNVSNDGSHTYFYDAEDRLIQVGGTLGNCSTATACYIYDAEGRRWNKSAGGVTVDYLHDLAGHEVTEANASAGWNRTEIYAGGRHLATYGNGTGGTTYFIHADWLGTERARSNVSGGSYETCTSLPFGDALTCTGTDISPMHFTGKQRDTESGLDDFDARYYASSLGRFMRPDEALVDQQEENPQSWNLYSYVRNNPLNDIDPSGDACVSNGQGGWKDNDEAGETCAQAFDPQNNNQPSAVVNGTLMVPGVLYGTNQPGRYLVGGCPLGTCHTYNGYLSPPLRTDLFPGLFIFLLGAGTFASLPEAPTAGGIGPVLKGTEGVNRAIQEVEAEGGHILGKEITIRNSAGTARPDFVYQDADGNIVIAEAKNGPTAGLNSNQAAVLTEFQRSGGQFVGGNARAAGLPPSAGPTPVRIFKY
jgi:RHS repeat-associated protein